MVCQKVWPMGVKSPKPMMTTLSCSIRSLLLKNAANLLSADILDGGDGNEMGALGPEDRLVTTVEVPLVEIHLALRFKAFRFSIYEGRFQITQVGDAEGPLLPI